MISTPHYFVAGNPEMMSSVVRPPPFTQKLRYPLWWQ
ncbi:hypothetical protein [Klebsiella phage vB_KpnS-VAC51]|uniref:Uncharacterized protein n=1 Tax=Klebsiella phage vB_KpnS-VAC51 TaxID=2866698 RepID=A0AAE9C6A0_9CAUD|nr:hypothetical protein [Klebsiella phage vB_KpnS-VAC51]